MGIKRKPNMRNWDNASIQTLANNVGDLTSALVSAQAQIGALQQRMARLESRESDFAREVLRNAAGSKEDHQDDGISDGDRKSGRNPVVGIPTTNEDTSLFGDGPRRGRSRTRSAIQRTTDPGEPAGGQIY